MLLVEKAKPYWLGPDVGGIFAALRTRFGISPIDARARLQGLRHDPRTFLQEHAPTVKKLAQIAYSDLPPANHEWHTFDAFVQCISDLGLHHQFLAREVATVKDALREGEAYLLTNQLHRSCGVSRLVEAELVTAHSKAETATLTTAVVNQLLTASKVPQVTDMVAKLVAALTPAPAKTLLAGPRGCGQGCRRSELSLVGIVIATDTFIGSVLLYREG